MASHDASEDGEPGDQKGAFRGDREKQEEEHEGN
jgi:hypothetical protein